MLAMSAAGVLACYWRTAAPGDGQSHEAKPRQSLAVQGQPAKSAEGSPPPFARSALRASTNLGEVGALRDGWGHLFRCPNLRHAGAGRARRARQAARRRSACLPQRRARTRPRGRLTHWKIPTWARAARARGRRLRFARCRRGCAPSAWLHCTKPVPLGERDHIELGRGTGRAP